MLVIPDNLQMVISESPRAAAGTLCDCGRMIETIRERPGEWRPAFRDGDGHTYAECCVATMDRLVDEFTHADLVAKGRC